jgi:hypothetical protein
MEGMMKRTKRIVIATLSGVLFGFVCFAFASSGSGKLPLPIMLQIIASRTLIGFAIGISGISLKHWSLHGLVMGTVFSLPLAFSGLMAPENPAFSQASMFISTVVMGLIYGLLIEVITSVLFRAKASH